MKSTDHAGVRGKCKCKCNCQSELPSNVILLAQGCRNFQSDLEITVRDPTPTAPNFAGGQCIPSRHRCVYNHRKPSKSRYNYDSPPERDLIPVPPTRMANSHADSHDQTEEWGTGNALSGRRSNIALFFHQEGT
ncbi:hypothetical protein BJ170DRAFT_680072 [Xylariales sp. AK1849]|nr:hypothetical protein BJ170DRAFT_680072 [Xylariales sp. AK1849]